MIDRPFSFSGVDDARSWLEEEYQRDRTEGQPWNLYLGIEKDALAALLSSWFEERGLPVLALRGYASETLTHDVRAELAADGRPSALIYAGDHDPTGEDIDRDFVARSGPWDKVVRVALSADQVQALDLPPAPGKATDSRAAAFAARHGALVQVELDAVEPDTLRDWFTEAIDAFWDGVRIPKITGDGGRGPEAPLGGPSIHLTTCSVRQLPA
jgi:hypothetical protein